jgi:hypothetical protein
VDLDREVVGAGRFEDHAGVGIGEGDAFDEDVHGVDQPFGGEGREHVVGDHLDVGIGVAVGFGRQGVGSEERGLHRDGAHFGKLAGNPERLAFVLQVEAVAGLHLDGGDAFGNEVVETGKGLVQKVGFAGGAESSDRRDDASALEGDFLVRGSSEAEFELSGPIACPNQVGVAIDQTRGDEPAVAVGHGDQVLDHGWREIDLGAGVGDTTVEDGDGTALDHAETGQIGADSDEVCVAPEMVGSGLSRIGG